MAALLKVHNPTIIYFIIFNINRDTTLTDIGIDGPYFFTKLFFIYHYKSHFNDVIGWQQFNGYRRIPILRRNFSMTGAAMARALSAPWLRAASRWL